MQQNFNHEINKQEQNLQYLAQTINNNHFSLPGICFQSQLHQNSQNFLSKLLPKFTIQNQIDSDLLAFNNRNTKNQSGNAKSSLFNPNNNNLFQTLIAANILRSNLQNSNINNTNLINFTPFTFKNVNMAVNLTTIGNHDITDIHYVNSQMKSISAFNKREKKIESCDSKRFDYSKLAQECSKTTAASTATTVKENSTENMQYMEHSEGITLNNENQFQSVKSYKYYKNNKRLVIFYFKL